ncbi:MAG: hypothetical protein OXG78_01870 [Chloroflexi bacterium]|nr:hypothetical protein [Chloroflexota bacterium]
MKKPSIKRRREHYRFETALPAELALARLHDLLPREVWGLQRRPLYQVSSEALDDTIFFEVREHVRDHRTPTRYVRVLTGQIREIDESTTLVDCEPKGAAQVPAIMFGFALVMSGIPVYLASRGELDTSELIGFGVIAALAFIFAFLSSNRKIARDPALDLIERAVQPRQEDRNLLARRRRRLRQTKQESDLYVAETMKQHFAAPEHPTEQDPAVPLQQRKPSKQRLDNKASRTSK